MIEVPLRQELVDLVRKRTRDEWALGIMTTERDKLLLQRPLSLTEARWLLDGVDDRRSRDEIFGALYSSHADLVRAYDRTRLREWLENVLWKNIWAPILMTNESEETAPILYRITESWGKDERESLRSAVDEVVASFDFTTSEHSPAVVRTGILVCGYFRLRSRMEWLHQIVMQGEAEGVSSDVDSPAMLALRVLAGMCEKEDVAMFWDLLQQPRAAAICTDAILGADPTQRDVVLARAVGMLRDPQGATQMVLAVLRADPEYSSEWVGGVVRRLWSSPSLGSRLAFAALLRLLRGGGRRMTVRYHPVTYGLGAEGTDYLELRGEPGTGVTTLLLGIPAKWIGAVEEELPPWSPIRIGSLHQAFEMAQHEPITVIR